MLGQLGTALDGATDERKPFFEALRGLVQKRLDALSGDAEKSKGGDRK